MVVSKLLLTGFDKFLSFPSNPSEEIVNRLKEREIGKYICHTMILPVDFEDSFSNLLKTLEKEGYDVVLSLWLAYGRNVISLERVALNLIDDGVRKDNRGRVIEDEKRKTFFFSFKRKANAENIAMLSDLLKV